MRKLRQVLHNVHPDDKRYVINLVQKLKAENAELRDALQELVDFQNGPPLVRYEKSWQEVMEQAYKLLSNE